MYLGGELSNAAYYFSTFAKVNSDTCYDFDKKIGPNKNDWQPFLYSDRKENAEKVRIKKELISKKNITDQTKRTNLTTYISQDLHCRQEEPPLASTYIDSAKAEPLHLKNNISKEMFLKLLHICFTRLRKTAKSFDEIPQTELIAYFLSFVRKEMGCNFLSTKVKQWCNEKGGKLDGEFTYRFRGKESFALLKNFPELVSLMVNKVSTDPSVMSALHKNLKF